MNEAEVLRIKREIIDKFQAFMNNFRKGYSESPELADLFAEFNLAINKFKEKNL